MFPLRIESNGFRDRSLNLPVEQLNEKLLRFYPQEIFFLMTFSITNNLLGPLNVDSEFMKRTCRFDSLMISPAVCWILARHSCRWAAGWGGCRRSSCRRNEPPRWPTAVWTSLCLPRGCDLLNWTAGIHKRCEKIENGLISKFMITCW